MTVCVSLILGRHVMYRNVMLQGHYFRGAATATSRLKARRSIIPPSPPHPPPFSRAPTRFYQFLGKPIAAKLRLRTNIDYSKLTTNTAVLSQSFSLQNSLGCPVS